MFHLTIGLLNKQKLVLIMGNQFKHSPDMKKLIILISLMVDK